MNRIIVMVFFEQKNFSWKVRSCEETSSLRRAIHLVDMYSFHRSEECARQTYDHVCRAYERIFEKLELKYFKGTLKGRRWESVESFLPLVPADSGLMGGSINHEYLAVSTVGEDNIQICSKYAFSQSTVTDHCSLVESSPMETSPSFTYLDVTADFSKIVKNANIRI